MNKLKIKIILGSTRPTRFGIQPAEWVKGLAEKNPNFDVELLDLKDYPMPFFEDAVSPAYSDKPNSNPMVQKWAEKIAEGDGFIIVTPEYNHSFPAQLKNALDYIYKEWNKKPVAFVSYGSVGGARVIEQLRLVAIELQMAPIRHSVTITNLWSMLDEKGNLKTETFVASAEAMLSNLEWWATALKSAR